MVGGVPRGGSRPQHDAGLREQRLSAGARGSPRWAGADGGLDGAGIPATDARIEVGLVAGEVCVGTRRISISRVLGSHRYAACSNLFCLLLE
ncbi:hypothetical protein PVAP13_1KG107100 [Panicum virgatum]|uniref:Uncharacterized protein n=1 Tax=Panicum virgatum TaxID=38727 RepID=A0A8T0XHR4_PANVG|nr:hypothetical protein PVAP13_1KG107100 [Panicum virgatum]